MESKWDELIASQHKAEEIVIERGADSMDELVLGSQRDLVVDALNREAIVLRLVSEALGRVAVRKKMGILGIKVYAREKLLY